MSLYRLPVQLLRPDAEVPSRAHDGDAGFDLRCVEGFEIEPGRVEVVGTGVAFALPAGSAGLVLPRSGLASKFGVAPVNSPGLIDSGYRGEVKIALINHGRELFRAQAGERVAQLMIVGFLSPDPAVVDELPDLGDGRDAGGFGSSGRT